MSKKTITADCVFFGEKDCNALRDGCVDPATCPFRKTEAEIEKSREKANAILRKLPHSRQEYIAEKYYRNKKVWSK